MTAGSNGVAAATTPNVCKMPGPPAPFVATPLPNIGKSGQAPKKFSKRVRIGGKAVAIRGASFGSQGDAASKATGGGLVSSNTHGPTKFVGLGSMDVKVEGKNVQLHGDPMVNNCGPSGSPPNAATAAGVVNGVVFKRGQGDSSCPHSNMTRSDPAHNQRKVRHIEQGRVREAMKKDRLLRRAVVLEGKGNLDLADEYFRRALAAEGIEEGYAWEQRVAKDTSAVEQSVEYECPDCGMQGEFDCVTPDGIVKEAKVTGAAVKFGQLEKHASAAAAIFPGMPVHAAIPRGAAKDVTSSVPRHLIQEHD